MSQRRILVTGAGSGIGLAVAHRLAADGHLVVGADLGLDRATPGPACQVDLATPEGNREAIDFARTHLGRIDAIVASAGIQHIAPVAAFDDSEWNRIMAVLLTSPFLLAKLAWPDLTEANEGGRFVAIASVHGLVGSPFKAAYVAAKHGVVGLMKVLALEGAEHGIAATAVCPGYVRTPLVERQIAQQAVAHDLETDRVLEDVILAPHAIKRLIEPDEVADLVAYLMTPSAGMMTGSPLTIDGGWLSR